MILEKAIIEHCSPTLAGVKTGSLFTVKYKDLDVLVRKIDELSKGFEEKNILLKIVRRNKSTALMYLYRENMLKRDMENSLAKKILSQYGYDECSTSQAVEKLISRLEEYDEFPHEIGLFLGYPPEDVEGFICNKGQNCSLCKYWKVYGNKEEALMKFAKYDKCKAVYKKLWQEGRDILRLTVKKQLVA